VAHLSTSEVLAIVKVLDEVESVVPYVMELNGQRRLGAPTIGEVVTTPLIVITLGVGAALAVSWWKAHKRHRGFSDAYTDSQSAKFYEKKYGITSGEAKKLVRSPHRKLIEQVVDDWKHVNAADTGSPMLRVFAQGKIRALAGARKGRFEGPPLCDDPAFARRYPKACR